MWIRTIIILTKRSFFYFYYRTKTASQDEFKFYFGFYHTTKRLIVPNDILSSQLRVDNIMIHDINIAYKN